ncbi:MAG: formylmethanofuran dehydrogenase subunit C, partial [Nitrososphaerales archaeon]
QPLDLRQVSPNVFAGKPLGEIRSLPIWIGNRASTLGELFEVKGKSTSNPEDLTIVIEGDLPNSRRIGSKMTGGKIVIDGRAGMYIGSEMRGGQITVKGDAGEWVGVGMKGGLIEIEGDVGDFLGAAYRGTRKGMKGGLIVVKGNAGCEAGAWMEGGTIKIMGNADTLPGIHMAAGNIFIGGGCPSRVGASMTGGKIVILGRAGDVLSGFQVEEIKGKAKVEGEKIPGPFYSFSGDHAEAGKGKLFVHKENNPHLAGYEKYLS